MINVFNRTCKQHDKVGHYLNREGTHLTENLQMILSGLFCWLKLSALEVHFEVQLQPLESTFNAQSYQINSLLSWKLVIRLSSSHWQTVEKYWEIKYWEIKYWEIKTGMETR